MSKAKHNKKHQPIIKVVLYSLFWLGVWSLAAGVTFILLLALLFNGPLASDIATVQDVTNRLLASVILLAGILSGVIWFLWKKKSLFLRVARNTLVVCVILGLLIGVPLSFVGEWGVINKSITTNKIDSQSNSKDTLEDGVKVQPAEKASDLPAQAQQTTPNSKPAEAQASKAGCQYYGDLPYSTVIKTDSSMKVGQTREIGGYNGWRKECKNESGKVISNTQTSDPTDKIIYHGTYTYEKALEDARAACLRIVPAGSQQSTQWGDCITTQMKKLW